MKIRTLAVGALALLVPLSAAACGDDDKGGSGERPSAEEIGKSLGKEIGLPEEQATCVGEKIYDSKISSDALRDAVDGKESKLDEKTESANAKIVAGAVTSCTGQEVGN